MDNGLIEFGESRKAEKAISRVFSYNGDDVTFARKGELVMVNATQMAKQFNKQPKDWTRLKSSKTFMEALMTARQISLPSDLVRVTNGDKGATWMHEDVAIEFARWLSPAFAIWCNDRIKELLTVGMTATEPTLEAMIENPDLVIGLATKLKAQREENARLEAENRKQLATITEQSEKIAKDAPKVDYFDAFMTASYGTKSTGIREVVKQAHIKSEKRFIAWMQDRSILFRQRKDNRLQPYAGWASCFDTIDVHDKKNDWSGKQLLMNPYGKKKIVKRYHDEQPLEFDSPRDMFNS